MLRIVDRSTMKEAARRLAAQLDELGFPVSLGGEPAQGDDAVTITVVDEVQQGGSADRVVWVRAPETLIEQALRHLPLDFDNLPLVVEGDSKIIREWTPKVVVERFKPTVYSYTHNRYGVAAGTEHVRARFTAEVFRRMNQLDANQPHVPRGAFLGLVEGTGGPLVVQRRMETCNLEIRVKRYHIGSPLHRYRFTEGYPTTQRSGPLRRWSRFDTPVVCFDWRHPLTDTEGHRLADEPISDDYAAVWMRNTPHAKEMARQAFLWLESLFALEGFVLVDICFFVDAGGRELFGEISPDCMRIRELGAGADPESAAALDKDLWRQGATAEDLTARYQELYSRLFGVKAAAAGGK